MYPHERSLVKRLAGKPFVILGVNSDQDREALKKALEKEHITWRSFYDQSTSGPIATRWNIHGWPTLFVIDHKGVIRQRYLGSPGDEALDKAIDKLVDEARTQARLDKTGR
jgi:Thioredoxin-like